MSESLQSLLRRAAAAIETPGDLTADELSHVAEDLAERANVLDAQPQGESPAQGAHTFGRWAVAEAGHDGAVLVSLGDRDDYARFYGPEADKCARLAATAPEMAAALRESLILLEAYRVGGVSERQNIRTTDEVRRVLHKAGVL